MCVWGGGDGGGGTGGDYPRRALIQGWVPFQTNTVSIFLSNRDAKVRKSLDM